LQLSADQLIPTLQLDDVLNLEDASPRTVGLLEQLAPFGRGNPHPRFLVQSVRIAAPPRRVGATGAHLQLTIERRPHVCRCIAFKMGELAHQLPVGTEVNLVVEPKLDHYTGTPRVALQVLDLARTSNEPFAL
jgi:single-stranded-DNA-specific exonuclease